MRRRAGELRIWKGQACGLKFTSAKANVQGATPSSPHWGYLDHKLMNLPHDLAVKALLLEQTCDLDRQFRKKRLVIWTGKRQTG